MYLLSGSEFTYIRSPTCLSFAPFPNNLGNFNSLAFPAHMDFIEAGLKHLYLAHELGEPTNLGIAKPTQDETDSSTSGCSTCWLVT